MASKPPCSKHSQEIKAARKYRERLLNDPYRPRYHFAVPDDDGRPGDPNGCFYAEGRHHLMYLYRRGERRRERHTLRSRRIGIQDPFGSEEKRSDRKQAGF